MGAGNDVDHGSATDAAAGLAHGERADEGGYVCSRGTCTESGRVRFAGLWSGELGAELTGDFCYAGTSHGDAQPFEADGDGVLRLVGAVPVEFRRSGGEWWVSSAGEEWERFTP